MPGHPEHRRSQSARARQRALPTAVCLGCGAEFVPARSGQRCCRPSCRAKASRDVRVNRYREIRKGLDALFGITDGDE
jgi:uncharacterized OB-fold protein